MSMLDLSIQSVDQSRTVVKLDLSGYGALDKCIKYTIGARTIPVVLLYNTIHLSNITVAIC